MKHLPRSAFSSMVGLALGGWVLAGCHGARAAEGAREKASRQVVDCLQPAQGTVKVQRDHDLVVLVHGCNSSVPKFQNLADEFRARGQQVACFAYDDRDSLVSSARELNLALDALRAKLGSGKVTLIGHSQGGLIARQAATAVDQSPIQVTELVTIAAPFAGVRSARDCGSLPLHILSLGISVGVCQMIAGRKWTEIHSRAPFMTAPPPLAPEVERHLALVTDETAACRGRRDKKCEQDNKIFTLQEQGLRYLPDAKIQRQVVKAGHAAIVGEEGRVAPALIALLEAEEILSR